MADHEYMIAIPLGLIRRCGTDRKNPTSDIVASLALVENKGTK
jgi:hypothetical protein